MSALYPTTIRLSLDALARHGGGTGPHRDGWGVGLWQDGEALVFREAEAAHGSPWVAFIEEHAPRSPIAMAHIRKATQGARLLRNTQPFARELGGRIHLFAHNGTLRGIEADPRFPSRRFRRIGDTDSEQAFCALLERLSPLWGSELPPLEARVEILRTFASELATLGPANFLYADGDVLIAHGHVRTQEDGTVRAPGLHLLCRACSAASEGAPIVGVALDASALQEVVLLASVPLSDEAWSPLAEGEMVVLREGRVLLRVPPRAPGASGTLPPRSPHRSTPSSPRT